MDWLDWVGLIVAMTWAALMTDWVLTRQGERKAKWAKEVLGDDYR